MAVIKVMIDSPAVSVDKDKVHVDRTKDEIEWQHVRGINFTVDFRKKGGGPFTQSVFNKAHPRSGKVRTDAKPGSRHPYTVTVGNQKLDPIVIVK